MGAAFQRGVVRPFALALSMWGVLAVQRSDVLAGVVDLQLRPAAQTVTVGDSVPVELYAVSADGGDQSVGFVGAVLVWDASALALTGSSDAGAFAWASSGFPSANAGLNVSFLDGDAYYQAIVSQGGPSATATAAGLPVTILQFVALSSATGPASIRIVPCVGSVCSMVLDRHPFDAGVTEVTGALGVQIEVTVQCQTSSQCDDGNPCTDDSCNAGNLCEFTTDDTNDPDDGVFCNGSETCEAGQVVVQAGSVPDCEDALSCTSDSCNETAELCDHTLEAGYCLIAGTCHPDGSTNPANACEACLSAIEPELWSPAASGTVCGDPREAECDGADRCDGLGGCQENLQPSGTPCGSHLATTCTAPDTCDGAGTCEPNNAAEGSPCDDGLFCTVVSVCTAGVCLGSGTACPDQVCDEVADRCKAVNVEVGPLLQGPYLVGSTVEIELYVVSATGTDQPINALDVVAVWDQSRLQLLGHVDNGPYPWFTSGFPDDSTLDGINDTFQDGNALYEASSLPAPNPPALATQEGLMVTTLRFQTLASGEAQIGMLREFGQFSRTKVLDGETPGLDITGVLGPPAVVDVVECFADPDCDDGEFCTGVATCVDNVCVPGTPPDCDDGSFCNGVETCEPGTGCVSPGDPCPDPDVCDDESDTCGGCAAPAVVAEGSRYLAVTPTAAAEPVAILVLGDSGDPGVLCLATYVQADGTLGATPVRRTPAEWGTVHVTGSDILPGTTYDVYADCRQDGSGFLSNPLRATTWFFGDVNNDGAAQIDDITLVFDGSQGVFGEGTTPQSLDVAPCAPDGVIDGDDVFYVQSAFAGAPFPCLLPCEACTPIEPPRANEMMVAKNRFVAFVDGNAGRSTAIRVSFAQLPPPYDGLNGLAMWVGEPREICENAAQTTPPDDGCGPAPGLGSRTFTAARLQCQAYYTDWSVYGAVYVYGEGVIPDGSYELQAIDEICDTSVENNYSAPFERTTSRWGDIVKNCTTDPCGAPDGLVNMTTDVTSLLDKFRNLSGAPIKARCDLAGLPPTDGELNLTIEILDVTHCLTAFVGGQYSFETIDPNRCP